MVLRVWEIPMMRGESMLLMSVVCLGLLAGRLSGDDVKETALSAPDGVTVKIRMEGPYTADVALQIVCYFKYTPEGVARMKGAPVELDKELGGVIAAVRERGEFTGEELETLVIIPPKGTIKAKALLLIGLGAEENLSVAVLERVGKVAMREAVRLGAERAAFAPLIRDQGNSRFAAADVEIAIVREALLAYDSELRLQKEGFSKPFALKDWIVEAGPAFYDETVGGAKKAISEAKTAIEKRATWQPIRSQ